MIPTNRYVYTDCIILYGKPAQIVSYYMANLLCMVTKFGKVHKSLGKLWLIQSI